MYSYIPQVASIYLGLANNHQTTRGHSSRLRILTCSSVGIIRPEISLLVAEALAPEEQALGAGLLKTANSLGRALGYCNSCSDWNHKVCKDRGPMNEFWHDLHLLCDCVVYFQGVG